MYIYNIYIGFTFNASVLQGRNRFGHTFLYAPAPQRLAEVMAKMEEEHRGIDGAAMAKIQAKVRKY